MREKETGDGDRSPVIVKHRRDRASTGEKCDWYSPSGEIAIKVNIALGLSIEGSGSGPRSMFAASAGAVKSLQKYNFLRQSTDSPELIIRQGKKNVSGTRAPGWLTSDAAILKQQRNNSPHDTDHLE
ncbi:hypothetical protein [Hoeflea alexandrii]|uniref:hypothetical protein n=1 Tax=Hoeflea alexandrii TaxID=288436 RepID=UPI0022AEBB56|nr:hypothetical protein [Hoeflea alexandrii]